ncbi:MAG: hypothetical protein RL748_919, partial [Pseudomonadota bacterium]
PFKGGKAFVAVIAAPPPPDRITLVERAGIQHLGIFILAKRTFHGRQFNQAGVPTSRDSLS